MKPVESIYVEELKLIEFDSMINIKLQQNNRSRSVEDPDMQQEIIALINEVVYE